MFEFKVEDRLMTIEEAARFLRISRTTLYRDIDKYPFVVRLERGIKRVSAAKLNEYLKSKSNSGR